VYHIPESFARFMRDLHGEKGVAWIDRLPGILGECARRWRLTIEPPFPNLTYHYVAPARLDDGTPVVLKACSPTGEFVQETTALRIFDGRGMTRLLAMDVEVEVMLLERLEPGVTLRTVTDDEAAMRSAAAVMRQIWRPAPHDHPFPTVADWHKGFARLRQHYAGGTGPFPPALVAEAETRYAELMVSAAPSVVLHGDLHQDNILAAQRMPWLGIDPKGVIGEPAYEVGALLRNFFPDLWQTENPGEVLARRVDVLAEELGFDRERIRGWGIYQAVLSAWWNVEDEGQGDQNMLPGSAGDVLHCAELLMARNSS
jgi:streptomycin 6-kinase